MNLRKYSGERNTHTMKKSYDVHSSCYFWVGLTDCRPQQYPLQRPVCIEFSVVVPVYWCRILAVYPARPCVRVSWGSRKPSLSEPLRSVVFRNVDVGPNG